MSFEKIDSLGENWNGYGANPINPAVILKAKIFFEKIKDSDYVQQYQAHVFPTANQSIQIEIHADNKYSEAEIFLNETSVFSCIDDNEFISIKTESIDESVLLFFKVFN